MKRGFDVLLPDLAATGGKPAIYLTAETVLAHSQRLADLPKEALLWLAQTPAPSRLWSTGAGGKWLVYVPEVGIQS